MDREQIIKSLECCIHSGTCRSCPYDEVVGCIRKREADALALIRELMAENERQKKTRYMAYPDGRLEMIPSIESVRADTVREMAERIKDARYMAYPDGRLEMIPSIESVRADTVRDVMIELAAMIGTYQSDSTIRVADVFKMLSIIKKDILEDEA